MDAFDVAFDDIDNWEEQALAEGEELGIEHGRELGVQEGFELGCVFLKWTKMGGGQRSEPLTSIWLIQSGQGRGDRQRARLLPRLLCRLGAHDGLRCAQGPHPVSFMRVDLVGHVWCGGDR